MTTTLIPTEKIENHIHLIRGHKVILDVALAELYGVSTKNLNKAVKRNLIRFPEDFMFQLTEEEYENLRFQIGTSNRGGRRYLPYAFSEQGTSMLSSVLRSKRAALVNIAIMRAFVKLRRILESNKELAKKLGELESKVSGHDKEIGRIFAAIYELMNPPPKPSPKIGFQNGSRGRSQHIKQGVNDGIKPTSKKAILEYR